MMTLPFHFLVPLFISLSPSFTSSANGSFVQWQRLDDDGRLDAVNSDAFAFFSGLVLPRPTFPFLIMNTLIDVDSDDATDALALLSHMSPSCGFQYRSSHTYWPASCIVGKVLAPTCRSVTGWVGPGRPTADLGHAQMARIRSQAYGRGRRLGADDVESMRARSDAPGPAAVDTVRMELLGLAPVQFAIAGLSWPLRLAFDVSFVAAWPCSDGPHPLSAEHGFGAVPVDEVVRVRGGGRRVLVVEAASVRDNEVPARAWCAHWGLSAVVADVGQTWCVASRCPPWSCLADGRQHGVCHPGGVRGGADGGDSRRRPAAGGGRGRVIWGA